MWDAWLNAGCAENWSQGWERQCLPSPLGCADGAGAQDTPSQPELCTPQRRPQNGAGGGWGSDRAGEGSRGSARAPPAGRGRTLPLPSDKRPRRPLPRTAHALTSTGERARGRGGGGYEPGGACALPLRPPPPPAGSAKVPELARAPRPSPPPAPPRPRRRCHSPPGSGADSPAAAGRGTASGRREGSVWEGCCTARFPLSPVYWYCFLLRRKRETGGRGENKK